MRILLLILSFLSSFSAALSAANTRVTLQIAGAATGNITVEIYDNDAPITAANFINYVKTGFYDGLIFHRVVKNFVVQTGGFDAELVQKTASESIINESSNGLQNLRGTLAMARTPEPHSANSQFFINLADNTSLNYEPVMYDAYDNAYSKYGYCVFGRVVSGMETVDAIAALVTTTENDMQNVPVSDVFIVKASIHRQVRFDAGDYGTITSGSEVQDVIDGAAVQAPLITPNAGCIFAGWDTNFNAVTADMVVTAQYITGSGTPTDPYCLSSASALITLAQRPDLWNSHIKLTADIDMSGTEYSGIAASWDSSFNGSFDGNGKIISNLTMHTTGRNLVSLLGNVGEQAIIKDLGIENIDIDAQNGYFIAAIAGWNKGVISGCYVKGVISGDTQVGGIVAGLSGSGKISNCYTQCEITAASSLAGGIASETADNAIIEFCYACGSIQSPWRGGITANHGSSIAAISSFYNADLVQWSATGTPKTDAQLRQKATFTQALWDFAGESANGTSQIWNTPCNDCYPVFSRQASLNADITGDGIVDFEDIALIASQWLLVK